ncbi:MAG: hypothetical protein QOK05_1453 [Chloroflexota bacterium]|jgi:hypothetical protein|nr:hypothetical protein [Chloroflexota bacterium]
MNLAPSDWKVRVQAAFPHPWDPINECLIAANMDSISHGTYVPKADPLHIDDVDIMMAVVPPPEAILGLKEFEHWVWHKDELDVVSHTRSRSSPSC